MPADQYVSQSWSKRQQHTLDGFSSSELYIFSDKMNGPRKKNSLLLQNSPVELLAGGQSSVLLRGFPHARHVLPVVHATLHQFGHLGLVWSEHNAQTSQLLQQHGRHLRTGMPTTTTRWRTSTSNSHISTCHVWWQPNFKCHMTRGSPNIKNFERQNKK